MRATLSVGLLAVLPLGCAERAGGDPDPTTPETDPRFLGEWMVDQPYHALYEASWYDFQEDGVLQHVRDCSLGDEVPTGVVSDPTRSTRCFFGERWSAPDSVTLVIAGTCSDERARDIVLAFPADTTANATGQPLVDVVMVGGEDGWGHFSWDWVWQRCGAESCPPTFTDVACP